MNEERARAALKKYFGYDTFLPNQWDVIQAIYTGRHSLAIMPTGGGKSICYQIPGITLPGICLVVSPLISLMKDQVESLRANGIPAAFLNSSQSAAEQHEIENKLFQNQFQLLYVSPEKVTSLQFLSMLKRLKINLFAIDEAHCISSWGHDFRPEYTQLRFIGTQFPDVPIAAFTATADQITREDIVQQLGLRDPALFIASFDRPNLKISVQPGLRRLERISSFLESHRGVSGIIYCLSRKQTERLCQSLLNMGIKADYYHAGLSPLERNRVQEAFQKDEIQIVCATIAFGMGIDKSNVRFVIHYNLPQNIESYYQEIGRAGRDGSEAETLLFYSFQDVMLIREILSDAPEETKTIKLAKLERMQQFAESQHCRRKMLLGYFGEIFEKNCGHCDICLSPPSYMDGLVLAQKALSALARLRERAGINLLIDILRGSSKKEILSKGYDQIKTYGAGKDLSGEAWKFYITQLIHMGLLEVIYHEYNRLKITDAGWKILKAGTTLSLVEYSKVPLSNRSVQRAGSTSFQIQQGQLLFEELRTLRLELARKEGVPPYIIFSDTSLKAMSEKLPVTDSEFLQIPGVATKKLESYGRSFMKKIQEFIQRNTRSLKPCLSETHLETLDLWQNGKSVETIAQIRKLSTSTIYSHLAVLIQHNYQIDLSLLISTDEMEKLFALFDEMEDLSRLKPIYEKMQETCTYDKIRLALAAYHQRQQKE